MKKCILWGEEVKNPLFDFCEKCFAMNIGEIERRYLGKRASATRKDQQEAPSREDFGKSLGPR